MNRSAGCMRKSCRIGAEGVFGREVVDRNLITSRTPDDLPAFLRETINAIARS